MFNNSRNQEKLQSRGIKKRRMEKPVAQTQTKEVFIFSKVAECI